MIPKRILLKETFFYTVSKTVPGFAGLASVILFMRIIGAEQYGQYSFLLSQWYLIVAIGFGWLNHAQLRYYSKDNTFDDYKAGQIRSIHLLWVNQCDYFFCVESFSTPFNTIMGNLDHKYYFYWWIQLYKNLFPSQIGAQKGHLAHIGQSILALSIPLGLFFLFQKIAFPFLWGWGYHFY
jgi:O-antigen/teichoic acid export membrane protein